MPTLDNACRATEAEATVHGQSPSYSICDGGDGDRSILSNSATRASDALSLCLILWSSDRNADSRNFDASISAWRAAAFCSAATANSVSRTPSLIVSRPSFRIPCRDPGAWFPDPAMVLDFEKKAATGNRHTHVLYAVTILGAYGDEKMLQRVCLF